mmetsp:Transcript_9524/g.18054  ORF Transcript_9524/g.18054 Transcript_9524/m.18054 type:complete len:293 (-) Transcript_9524:2841-3719(-)
MRYLTVFSAPPEAAHSSGVRPSLQVRLTLALCLTSRVMVSSLLALARMCSTVSPLAWSSLRLGSAPPSISTGSSMSCFSSMATHRQVWSLWSRLLADAPCSSKNFTISLWPLAMAKVRAVCSSLPGASRSTLSSLWRALMVSKSSFSTAACKSANSREEASLSRCAARSLTKVSTWLFSGLKLLSLCAVSATIALVYFSATLLKEATAAERGVATCSRACALTVSSAWLYVLCVRLMSSSSALCADTDSVIASCSCLSGSTSAENTSSTGTAPPPSSKADMTSSCFALSLIS